MARMRSEGEGLIPLVGGRDHAQGSASAPVVLVEYGDYECPYTRKARHVVSRLRREFGDRLLFVYRHFPLSVIHPRAQKAAEAAETAAAQGRFWPMHEGLFDNQRHLEGRDLTRYAADLGLDLGSFGREMEEGSHEARVREDLASGERGGVRGTPTFFVNGIRNDGPNDLETLALAVGTALEAGREGEVARAALEPDGGAPAV